MSHEPPSHLFLRRLAVVVGVVSTLIVAAPEAEAATETYYGFNAEPTGEVTLIGLSFSTSYTITPLSWEDPSPPAMIAGTVAAHSRVDLAIGEFHHFKIETSEPLIAIYGHDCCDRSGSFFYPISSDGKRAYGHEFVISPMASDVEAETVVFAMENSSVEVRNGSGDLIHSEPALVADSYVVIPSLTAGEVYTVESTGRISVLNSASNGVANVPPIPVNGNDDCGSDVGTDFYLATQAVQRGAIRVINPGTSAARFDLIDLATGNRVIRDQTVAPGGYYYDGNLGKRFFKLVASTGELIVWSGDTEMGNSVQDFGDDVTTSFGHLGMDLMIHSRNFGSHLFAADDNTSVVINGGSPITLDGDDYIELHQGKIYEITADKPVFTQTVGGADGLGLDDWATALRPVMHYDTDGDGVPDFEEGGYCESTAPDSDGDGIHDYRDPDDGDGPLEDCDGDGLTNGLEDSLGLDPCNSDSDGDGIGDWTETDGGLPTDTDDDGVIDALDDDSDDDGLLDSVEGTADDDGDGIGNWRDPDDTDGPDGDADGDGVPNSEEDPYSTDKENLFDPSDAGGIQDPLGEGEIPDWRERPDFDWTIPDLGDGSPDVREAVLNPDGRGVYQVPTGDGSNSIDHPGGTDDGLGDGLLEDGCGCNASGSTAPSQLVFALLLFGLFRLIRVRQRDTR